MFNKAKIIKEFNQNRLTNIFYIGTAIIHLAIFTFLLSYNLSICAITEAPPLRQTTSFMFCGVNQGYQGNLMKITDPQKAMEIVRKKLIERNDGANYEFYPGIVTYRKDYGCPDGGEVIAVVVSSVNPDIFIKIGKFLQDELSQTSLSIATYNGSSSANGAKRSRGFQATVIGFPINKIASAWQYQAEKNMSSTMYVTAGFYTKENDDTVFIQGEANPEKPHLNSKEKIQKWEKMAILVAQETGKFLGIGTIQLKFEDIYFKYLVKN